MKKRDKPAQNPLKGDAIRAATRHIEKVEAEDAPSPAPTAPEQELVGGKRRPEKPTTVAVRVGSQKDDFKKLSQRTRFNFQENHGNEQFTMIMQEALGSKVHDSDVSRAFWELLRRYADEFKKVAPKHKKVVRPPYGDKLGAAEYEHHIANLILRVLKRVDDREPST